MDLEPVSEKHAAQIVGISRQRLSDLRKDGAVPEAAFEKQGRAYRWHLPELFQWRLELEVARAAPSADLESGESTEALEKLRQIRYEREKWAHERDQKQWLKKEDVAAAVQVLTDSIRRAGETLQKDYGPDAQELLDGHLDEADSAISEMFADDDG